MTGLMIVEIFENNKWVESMFSDIVIGSKFRMRNPNTKEIFVGDGGKTEFVAISEVYVKTSDGRSLLTVDIDMDPTFEYAGMKICTEKDIKEN